MTDEYVLQQEFGDGVDHPVHRLEYCREAVRAECGDRIADAIDAPDVVTVDIREGDGFVAVQHTLTTEAAAQGVTDAIATTDCEVVAEASAYRDKLGVTEVLYCAVPTEWVGEERVDVDGTVADWEAGDHVTTVRPTKAEAWRDLRLPLVQIGAAVLVYLYAVWYVFVDLASKDSLVIQETIAKYVVSFWIYALPFIVFGWLLSYFYPRLQAYRNAREG